MKTTTSFLDKIMPTFGNHRENIPIYSDSQKMFVSAHYTSAAGNMYFKGLRFTDRIVMIEKVGLYKNFTYIDSIELFAFDGGNKVLIGKVDYEKTFYNADRIKEDAKTILSSYIENSAKLAGEFIDSRYAIDRAAQMVEVMYDNPLRTAISLKSAYKELLLEE